MGAPATLFERLEAAGRRAWRESRAALASALGFAGVAAAALLLGAAYLIHPGEPQ